MTISRPARAMRNNQEFPWSPELTTVLNGRWDAALLNRADDTLGRCDKNGNYPLHRAARAGQRAFVERFSAQCSLEKPNISGQTPLFLAVESESLETVQWLLAQRVNCLAKGTYPLAGSSHILDSVQLAVIKGNAPILKSLLDVPIVREMHFTLLRGRDNLFHIAARYRPDFLGALLRESGRDANSLLRISNSDNRTPLEELGHTEGLQAKTVSVQRGLPEEIPVKNWTARQWQFLTAFPVARTPFEEAVLRSDCTGLDRLFEAPHEHGDVRSLLDFSLRYRPTMASRLLGKHYPAIEQFLHEANGEGRTPFMEAAWLGNEEALSLMQKKGLFLGQKDSQGRTALHHAVLGLQEGAVNRLCLYGFDLNHRDAQGRDAKELVDTSTVKGELLYRHINHLLLMQQELREKKVFDRLHLPETLVLQGGGAKGIVYEGAICRLQVAGVLAEVKRVAGTSAGAITAALIALGCSAEEVVYYSNQQDFREFVDQDLSNVAPLEGWGKLAAFVVGDLLPAAGLTHFPVDPRSHVQGFLQRQKCIDLSDPRLQRLLELLPSNMDVDLSLAVRVGRILHALDQVIGVCSGEKLRLWMEEIVEKKTGIKHCTFGELAKLIKTGSGEFRHLHMFATNLATLGVDHISSEEEEWKDVIISDAVRASLSIPVFFKPHSLHVKNDRGERVPRSAVKHVDGGMQENFPIEWFDKEKYLSTNPGGEGKTINPRTLGISLFSTSPQEAKTEGAATIRDLLKKVLSFYYDSEARNLQKTPENAQRTIMLDTGELGMVDFDMSEEAKGEAAASGDRGVLEGLYRLRAPSLPCDLPWNR